MLTGIWILAQKVGVLLILQRSAGIIFYSQISCTLANEIDSFLSLLLLRQFPFSKAVRCPWEPQTSGPKANHLSPEKKYQKQCAWSYWPPEAERQISFQLQPFLESAGKASHGDLRDLDAHLIRAGLPALAACGSRQPSSSDAFWLLATGTIFKPTTYNGKIFPSAVP